MPTTNELFMTQINIKLYKEAGISAGILVLIMALMSEFLLFTEARKDVVRINDPLVNFLPAYDLSLPIFIILYFCLIFSLWLAYKEPEKGIAGIQAFSLMMVIRMIVMYLLPLAPPAGNIVLYDPVVEQVAIGKQLTQDLFFSGHTSTVFLLYLAFKGKKESLVFLAATIIIGLSVLLMHSHYTIDVIAAPFFAFGAFKIIAHFRRNKSLVFLRKEADERLVQYVRIPVKEERMKGDNRNDTND